MTSAEKATRTRNLLHNAQGGPYLSFFGNTHGGLDLSELDSLIAKASSDNAKLSFILADINNCFGMAYNCDMEWTSQSTIKAPYLTSVLIENPAVFPAQKDRIRKVITVSDNDAYAELRDIFGNSPFEKFCEKAEISDIHAKTLYPRSITVRNMALLWTVMYEFFETTDMKEYVSYFGGTAMSCIHYALGNKYPVKTKAGWESGTGYDGPGGIPAPEYIDNDPSNDEIATNDTGIVYSGQSPYILAIFSHYQADPERLVPIASALDSVHSKMLAKQLDSAVSDG